MTAYTKATISLRLVYHNHLKKATPAMDFGEAWIRV